MCDKMIWYLASPYTKYERGHRAAFYEAAEAAGKLIATGLVVYSPIAHSHPVAIHGDLDALDGAFWERQNTPMLAKLDGLIVLQLPGWQESAGVRFEVEYFERAGRPIIYAAFPMDVAEVATRAALAAPAYV